MEECTSLWTIPTNYISLISIPKYGYFKTQQILLQPSTLIKLASLETKWSLDLDILNTSSTQTSIPWILTLSPGKLYLTQNKQRKTFLSQEFKPPSVCTKTKYLSMEEKIHTTSSMISGALISPQINIHSSNWLSFKADMAMLQSSTTTNYMFLVELEESLTKGTISLPLTFYLKQ